MFSIKEGRKKKHIHKVCSIKGSLSSANVYRISVYYSITVMITVILPTPMQTLQKE